MSAHGRITTTVSTNGQVILPKAMEDIVEGVLSKPTPLFAAMEVDAVFGSLRTEGPPLSVDEMNAAVAKQAKQGAAALDVMPVILP